MFSLYPFCILHNNSVNINLLNKYSLIVFLEAFFCSVGNLFPLTGLANKLHFLRIRTISFDKFFAIMAEKDDTASVRIKGYFLLSIGRDIHEVALDTIKSSILSFWSRCGCGSCVRHMMQL